MIFVLEVSGRIKAVTNLAAIGAQLRPVLVTVDVAAASVGSSVDSRLSSRFLGAQLARGLASSPLFVLGARGGIVGPDEGSLNSVPAARARWPSYGDAGGAGALMLEPAIGGFNFINYLTLNFESLFSLDSKQGGVPPESHEMNATNWRC